MVLSKTVVLRKKIEYMNYSILEYKIWKGSMMSFILQKGESSHSVEKEQGEVRIEAVRWM